MRTRERGAAGAPRTSGATAPTDAEIKAALAPLEAALNAFGLPADAPTLARFETYMRRVLFYNRRVNLTAVTEPAAFVRKHFIDALAGAVCPETIRAKSVIDVGTGAGFPGLPLAIVLPGKDFLLADALEKRVRVLDEIVRTLDLPRVRVRAGRAEELAREPALRESFDLCVARAVAKLPVLAEYALPFVRPGGFFLAYKGEDVSDETEAARRALAILGGRIVEVRVARTPGADLRHSLVVAEKTETTPDKYPRRAGVPARRGL